MAGYFPSGNSSQALKIIKHYVYDNYFVYKLYDSKNWSWQIKSNHFMVYQKETAIFKNWFYPSYK
jgi:hypothetical protein